MTIRTALNELATLQASLSITDPIVQSIQSAHVYPPPMAEVPDPPFWINTYTLLPLIRGSGFRETQLDVRMQLFVYDSDQDIAGDIATAFLEEFLDALDGSLTLGGTTNGTQLVGGTPTLVGLELNNYAYVGLDLHLQLNIKEAKEFSA